MNDVKILLINESDGKSMISDIFTFGILIGSFWFNFEYLGNGLILQFVLGVCFFVMAAARGSRKVRRMTLSEVREYLCAETQTTAP